jgi:putative membrane protein
MAGILYLIRLFVYHAEEKEDVVKQRFCVMEQKLYSIITIPAMTGAFIFGCILILLNGAILKAPWFHAKLLFVVVLIGVTHSCGPIMRKLQSGKSKYTGKFLRIYNELPTVLMIIIVFLVILK